MSLKTLPIRIVAISFFLVVGLGVAFYLLVGRAARVSVTDEILARQEIIAKAEASNIESFFEVFGDSISVLSQLRSITSSSSVIWDLDVFIEQWRDSGIVDGVALTNEKGILQLNSNIEGTHSIGVSLADRDYFSWAKNEAKVGEHFTGTPVISRLGASKDSYIVPVASPVYQNGVFRGVLVSAVSLEHLTKNYLEVFKVSDSTDVFLINHEGNLFYSNTFPNGVGLNIFDLLSENPFLGSEVLADNFKDVLSKEGGGKEKISYMDPLSGKVEVHAVAYSPVEFDNQKWFLVMASPIQNLWKLGVPMNIRVLALALITIVSIVVFGAVTVKSTQKRLS